MPNNDSVEEFNVRLKEMGYTEEFSLTNNKKNMNNTRRKRIQKLKDKLLDLLTEIEEIKDEEQEAYDNLPGSLQDGEQGEKMSEAIDNLDSAYSSLEEVSESLGEAMQ